MHDPALKNHLNTTSTHIKKLEELGVKTVRDFLLFFPRNYDDKREYTAINELRTDQINNVRATIQTIFHRRTQKGMAMTKAVISDGTGNAEVLWFNQEYLKRVLFKGAEVILSGKAKYVKGKPQLMSPSYEAVKKEQMHSGRLVPVYHQTEGITSKWIREKLKPLIEEWKHLLKDYLPPAIIKDFGLMDYATAIQEAHFPTTEENLMKAKKRLSFDELFLLQLKALQKKWRWQNVKHDEQKKIPYSSETAKFLQNLSFELTLAQKKSLKEIMEDLEKPYPMSRLLQGDVGSGKTVVAAAAVFNCIMEGYQSTVMAPTEILAKQHFHTLFKLLKPYSLNIQFISGSTPKSVKEDIITQINSGTVDLVIGTHALIQEGIHFKKLGLAVIDEQHRFGVKQRDILKSHGSPHLLSLSATPIPRTLAMTLYGDQDLSIIDEMPKGRLEIITRIVPEPKRQDAYHWIKEQIKKGRQAFVICPLIDESDVLEVKSAIEEYEHLKSGVFSDLKLGLLHGKMPPKEKEETMLRFANNKINVLVSTSVIEVGIDVPNASIMMIEGAERFGLSQLHQFRGRVGRGEYQSYCFLMPKNQSQEAQNRLQAMVKHSSGFKLSEIDLELRGPGEIYGVRQSGIPDLKMASLTDNITIELARKAAQTIITQDPELKSYPELYEKLQDLQEVFIKD